MYVINQNTVQQQIVMPVMLFRSLVADEEKMVLVGDFAWSFCFSTLQWHVHMQQIARHLAIHGDLY